MAYHTQCGSRRSRCRPWHTAARRSARRRRTDTRRRTVRGGRPRRQTAIHPTSAALLPRIARSTDDLINANLWVAHCDSASALVGSLTAGVVVGLGWPAKRCSPPDRCGPPSRSPPRCGGRRRSSAPAWGGGVSQPQRVIRRALAELREHPWSRGVLCVSSARNLIVGAFDVLLVVLALDVLDLGDGGPGYLSALVGAGALVSTFVTPSSCAVPVSSGALMVAIAVAATLAIVLGVVDRDRRGRRGAADHGVGHGRDGRPQPDAAAAVERSAPAWSAVRRARVRRRARPAGRIGGGPGGDGAGRSRRRSSPSADSSSSWRPSVSVVAPGRRARRCQSRR